MNKHNRVSSSKKVSPSKNAIVSLILKYDLLHRLELQENFHSALFVFVNKQPAVKLTRGCWEVILGISKAYLTNTPTVVSDLCLMSTFSESTVKNHIRNLEKMGLIEKHPDENDRRRYFVELTKPYRKILDVYVAECSEEFKELIDLHDKHERDKALEELRSQEELFRSITSAAKDAIIMMDDKGEIVLVNEAAERMFGFKREKILGESLHKVIVSGRYYAAFEKGFAKFKKTGKGKLIGETVELPVLRKDGTEFYADHSFSSVKLNGKWHAITTIRDTTDRKLAEAALLGSEEKFRNLVEGSIQGYCVHKDFKLIFANQAFADILGYTNPEEIMALDSWFCLIDPSEHARLARYKKARLKGERVPIVYEFKGRRKDGSIVHLENRVHLINWEGKEAIQSVTVDITERKQAEQKLIASQKETSEKSTLLRATLDSIDQGFAVWDEKNRLVIWNNKCMDFWLSPDSVRVGMSKLELLRHIAANGGLGSGNAEKLAKKRHRELMEEGTDSIDDFKLPDGREIHVRRYPISKVYHTAVYSDVTLRRRHERNLSIAKERAEHTNQVKSEFLASLSHDLRTPLTSIKGFSDMILSEVFGKINEPRYGEYVSDISHSASHLLEMINDLLDIAKIEAGKMEIREEEVDVSDIIDFCLEVMKPHAISKSLELKRKVPKSMPLILGDHRIIRQILLNLASNAVKFTQENGWVAIWANTKKRETVTLGVTDNGPGIASEDIKTIMEPYIRLDNPATNQNTGTGLGVPLSKMMTELHGGEFAINSQLGSGTTVSITFPQDRVLTG